MKTWFFVLLSVVTMAFMPAKAFEPAPLHNNAREVAKMLLDMPQFDGAKIVEKDAKGLAGLRTITLGDEEPGKISVSLLSRDGKLIGARFDVPLLPKADPGLYAFIDLAAALEPAMQDLRLGDKQSPRDALKTWASEIGIESWMRPRYGAYRVQRRVGDTLYTFEGAPLQGFWIAISHAGDRHPVLDDILPFVPESDAATARPILEAVERGEYALARQMVTPHVEAGKAWAMLVLADYAEPVGPGRQISARISKLLEQSAAAGYAPAQHVLGQPQSNFAERNLTAAAKAGYAPAIALKARRRYTSGRADDPAARCDELAAIQGDAMAQLRTVYRYAEGGGEPETAWFWGRVTLETFGEATSITVESYILHTLEVLSRSIEPGRQDALNADAEDWRPRSFAELKPKYDALNCLD